MGGFLTLVEDRPTPKSVYNWRVYACAAVASFASCMIGYDSAFIGTTLALPSFTEEFRFEELSDSKLALVKSNIGEYIANARGRMVVLQTFAYIHRSCSVSIYQAGAFFGAFFAYPTAFFYGRKLSLIIYSLVFILGAGMMLGANGDRGLGERPSTDQEEGNANKVQASSTPDVC